jgi:hypothetical protein
MKANQVLVIFFFLAVHSFGQLKGNARHLAGTWRYDGGSGYEVWEEKQGELIGYGYRTTKFNDTLRVEELRIALVNNRLVYSLITRQHKEGGIVINDYKFISSGKRKLRFVNIENESPREVAYRLGIFNKRKLRIEITYDGKPKPVVLRLYKEN